MCYNFGFPKEPTEAFPEGTSDAIVLEGWSNIVAHVAAHFICGGLMIPVVLAGDWAAASERRGRGSCWARSATSASTCITGSRPCWRCSPAATSWDASAGSACPP